jgi:multicomponent Na+:H+ antiporter subunit G
LEIIRHILVAGCFFGGVFFFIVGTVGLMRMPDAYCRMHATTKCDTLGTGLLLVGLIILQGFSVVSAKLFVIVVFVWLTNPTAAHIIAKAAYSTGMIQGINEDSLASGEEGEAWRY